MQEMNSSILRQTAYSYPCFLLASCHATCAVVCLPAGVFSSINKPCASAFGTHRNKSGNPAFVPIALNLAASRKFRRPPFGLLCNNFAYSGYCMLNHLTHCICIFSSMCLIARLVLVSQASLVEIISIPAVPALPVPALPRTVKPYCHR